MFLGWVFVELREGGEVGYMLAPEARGRGVMTEAVRAVVRWAHEAGIQRFESPWVPCRPGGLEAAWLAEPEADRDDGTLRADLGRIVAGLMPRL